jgi:hypothetical protein
MKKMILLILLGLVSTGVLNATASSLTYTHEQKMNNYVDQYGRYHDKPVTQSNPVPSNNGWIYTAYAKKAGLWIDDYKLKLAADLCDQGYGVLWRTPGDELPPMSRDEILGLAELGLLKPEHLRDWNFSPYPLPKFSLVECIKQFWEQRGKHRNYFWQNNLSQMYHFAFSVPLVDRHFILSKQGKFNLFYWAVAKVDSMLGKESGIRFLKYGKSKKAMQQEFPADHPIRNI